MKLKFILYGFIFFWLFAFASADTAQAQCKDESGVYKCAELFTPDGITFMNEFNVNTKRRRSAAAPNGEEFEIYLLADRKYRFALCCYDGLDDIVLRLYNEETTENNPLATTFHNGKDRSYFDFECPKEGKYNVSIRFKEGKGVGEKLCAIGLLGYGGRVK